jgi:hypothetical protein
VLQHEDSGAIASYDDDTSRDRTLAARPEDESYRPAKEETAVEKVLGSTVTGGMIAASAVAIFLIPVTFYVIERLFAGRRSLPEKHGTEGLATSPAPA